MRRVRSLAWPGLLAGLAALSLTGAAGADPLPGVGEVGLSFGQLTLSEFRGDAASVPFLAIKGSYSLPLGDQFLLGLDLNWRRDSLGNVGEFGDAEDPESQSLVGAHLLWSLSEDTRLGGFVAYGDTRMQDTPREENYDYFLLGLEARHFFTEDLMVYAQLGAGDKRRGGQDVDEGFNSGKALRLGATWFVAEHSALTLDFEYAEADPYIDGRDAGRFISIGLSGETRFSVETPIYATYGVRKVKVDGTTETDGVDEFELALGVKWVFGPAGSPREAARAGRSIGLPELPGRASAWTEFID